MLTIFGCPKPFRGLTAIHQYNSIQSWQNLHPDLQVILVGNEEGIAQASRELGVTHAPECELNEFGTPLVSSIFAQAREHSRHNILCYANPDIILTSSFISCLHVALRRGPRFLLVGKRWDLDLDTKLDFQQPHWEHDLLSYTLAHGKLATEWQIDYHCFPKGALFQDMPPFAIGRQKYDNWMIWSARANRIPVIDASSFITAIHQNHDYIQNYSHPPESQKPIWDGPETIKNHEMAGGWPHIYSISDASHKIRGLDGRSLPYLFPCILPQIKSRVRRALRSFPVYVACRNATKMILRGEWGLAWAKLVKKLNAGRDRTEI